MEDEYGTDSRNLTTPEFAGVAPVTPKFDRDRAEEEALHAELGDRAASAQVLENTPGWFTGEQADNEALCVRQGILLDVHEGQRRVRAEAAEKMDKLITRVRRELEAAG